MSFVIKNNLMAANAARILNQHYSNLATSTRRLSSGLRINSAADDAAGLAIRELQRADIAAMYQGTRNANDAISLIQTADGALAIIDEKLIRMKELAEQAATGTYNSTQRLMIHSEFQAMAEEINRIAYATDFNNVKLLDGSLSGTHDGHGLQSTGAMKIHFGPKNNSAEDYYYIQVPGATIADLGLGIPYEPAYLNERLENGAALESFPSGIVSFVIIPQGTKNISLHLYDHGQNDTIQLFTRNGLHLAGTPLSGNEWRYANVTDTNVNSSVMTVKNGFNPGVSYTGPPQNSPAYNATQLNTTQYNGMNISYSGDGNPAGEFNEYLTVDEVTEDLIVLCIGGGVFSMQATWDAGTMPTRRLSDTAISIKTQDAAQKALGKIDNAIVKKDQIRAHLGAMQNRLENTVSNLSIQAENLQAAESRISDVDVATEVTELVRNQILTESGVAMLSQANSLPQIAMQLIGG